MDLFSYIDRGGVIVYILIALNIIGFSIIFWKFFNLVIFRSGHEKIVQNIVEDLNGSVKVPGMIRNSINIAVKRQETGLNTIKIIAIISPLLGLLGTVIGVLTSFDNITVSGLGDPTIFSGGISIALITTVAGLLVAIPHYVAYNYFLGVLDNLELKIEKEVLKKL
ncbi:MAG: MotA/TolQ/ExbB proton channel family protein [Arcobacteraceae bacterium]|nr:MotA/TolQ/ExbB proton channel family protein [Arcobacteraceae bacterium]